MNNMELNHKPIGIDWTAGDSTKDAYFASRWVSFFYFREGRGNGGKVQKCSEVAWIYWTARDSTGT
ncbi:hypothetical protein D3C76_308620 [compost metagenome]